MDSAAIHKERREGGEEYRCFETRFKLLKYSFYQAQRERVKFHTISSYEQ